MIIWPASALREIRAICDRHDVLLIVDEVLAPGDVLPVRGPSICRPLAHARRGIFLLCRLAGGHRQNEEGHQQEAASATAVSTGQLGNRLSGVGNHDCSRVRVRSTTVLHHGSPVPAQRRPGWSLGGRWPTTKDTPARLGAHP